MGGLQTCLETTPNQLEPTPTCGASGRPRGDGSAQELRLSYSGAWKRSVRRERVSLERTGLPKATGLSKGKPPPRPPTNPTSTLRVNYGEGGVTALICLSPREGKGALTSLLP